MKLFTIIFAFIFIGFAFYSTLAQTPEQLIIETSKKLEEKPFDKETLKSLKHSMKWIHQNRKFHLTCGISGSYLPISYKFRSNLFAAFIFGTVAFNLEDAAKSKNLSQFEAEDAAKNAGLISMVKSYEAIIKIKPEAELKKLDQLLAYYKNNANLVKLFDCDSF